ncbi:predicted protein [Naegleria gruberi]|uniref:Predicted protein n=1 Tax=Naegleria gruberi TaxID=5762 RepID=D2VFK3_NAEGR|nr:uncharacterized protein NAEGRDRAFT_49127 [Naegleria gruberi]EFC44374.1 predicted protein [Naegleria gruberi]|eukprot:XP_002677118.1 predicted protein [Naegleria gruberi strain NEG-M]
MVWKTNFDKSLPNYLFENNLAPPQSNINTYAGIEEDQMADRLFRNVQERPQTAPTASQPIPSNLRSPIMRQQPQHVQQPMEQSFNQQSILHTPKQQPSTPLNTHHNHPQPTQHQQQPRPQPQLNSQSTNFQSVYLPPPIQTDNLPPTLSNTLEHILRQLDIITQTVKVMEDRLTLTEHKLSKIEINQKKIIQMELANQLAHMNIHTPQLSEIDETNL